MERDIFGAAVRVMEQVSKTPDPVGVRELARVLGMAAGSTHRALQALKRERFVVQAGDRGPYSSGARLLELAGNLVRTHDLVPAARPFLEQAAKRSHESVVLMVAEANQAACVASVDSQHVLRIVFPAGWRGPLYWGASGRLLLAYQPQDAIHAIIRAGMRAAPPDRLSDSERLLASLATIKRTGYAVSHGERAQGFTSVAAAVRGPNGNVVASVAMYGPSARFSRTRLPKHLALVRSCADAIGEALVKRQPPRDRTSPPDSPKGEYRSAQHEGGPVSGARGDERSLPAVGRRKASRATGSPI
jgi:DNA-binding IclR family transcriptional regulator